MAQPLQQFAVFLCSYNGERFIMEQIRSIAHQTAGPIQLFISDDGSTDKTLLLIEQAKIYYPELRIQVCQGPKRGFQYNFMKLFDRKNSPACYLAFADQDDIWEPNKLERAKQALEKLPADTPGLYGGRSRYVNENNIELGLSSLFTKPPSFANALVQCMFGGATMVMNEAAWRAIHAAPVEKLVSHDWWLYQMISAIGGSIIYDPSPTLRYRQHGNNIMGANTSFKARYFRAKLLMQNHFRNWNDINLAALAPYAKNFTEENQKIFQNFQKARQSRFPWRIFWFMRSGVYRQTALGNTGLWVAAILGKC